MTDINVDVGHPVLRSVARQGSRPYAHHPFCRLPGVLVPDGPVGAAGLFATWSRARRERGALLDCDA
jgi:hypothetical protein